MNIRNQIIRLAATFQEHSPERRALLQVLRPQSKCASESGSLWEEAVKDLQQFNKLYAEVARRPQDPTRIKKCIRGTDKLVKLFVWGGKALAPVEYDSGRASWRQIRVWAKREDATIEEMSQGIERFRDSIQNILDSLAPEHFTHQGFKIDNPEHLSRALIDPALDGFDFLRALFKRRGVGAVLDEGIRRVILTPDKGAQGFFNSRTRELTLSVHNLVGPGRFTQSVAGETLIHEFGHFIHRTYITGEAAEAWDTPWAGIPSLADPRNRALMNDPKRIQSLDRLDIVTDYGKVDQYEDFAETFLVFIVAPDKLTPASKFRMQRALSLSGLYGKPVMRIAHGK